MFSVPISLLGTTQHSARTIVYCIQHQRRVVDDVLTLSKLDSDLLTVSPCPVQPVKLVREALEIFDGQLRTADINFQIEEDPSLQDLGIDWVVLDPGRVLQVLMSQSPPDQTINLVSPESSTHTLTPSLLLKSHQIQQNQSNFQSILAIDEKHFFC